MTSGASFWQLPPDARLREWTDAFSCSTPGGERDGAAVRLIPDGRCELIFYLDPTTGTCRGELFGLRSTASVIAATRTENISVRLRPLATAPFLGVAASELTDRAVPVETLWGSRGRALEQELARCASMARRGQCIADFLHARSADARDHETRARSRVQRALRRVHASGGAIRLSTVAREVDVSLRQLQREFATHVGLSPKRYARIVRLHGALRMLQAARAKVDAALHAGLYDQAHLSHEARALTGATVTELLASSHVGTSVAITSFR
jgi:AraC-like DNA-binding protein